MHSVKSLYCKNFLGRFFLLIALFTALSFIQVEIIMADEPQHLKNDPIPSIVNKQQNAIIILYRPSCPLSSYIHSLFTGLKESCKKQIKWFIEIELDAHQVAYYKQQYGMTQIPALLFFKDGNLVWRYVSDDQFIKSMIESKIRSLYKN